VWGVLELGQLLLAARSPDVTDVLVPTLAAAAGGMGAGWIGKGEEPIPQDERHHG